MITIDFINFEEMMGFAQKLVNTKPVTAEAISEPVYMSPVETPAPLATPADPVVAPVQIMSPPIQPPAPVVPAIQPPAPAATTISQVPTTAKSYTSEDLARAAAPLMDSGRYQDLIQLLQGFGVDTLPALPPAQYGVFAMKLREMGAQI